MDVNRTNGATYAPSFPPTPGSVESAPTPYREAVAVAPSPQQIANEEARAPERVERTESASDALRRAVEEVNSSVAIHRRHLGIRFHEPTNRRIVTVYDSDTNEALREIPPERILEAHANMLEMVGLFMNTRG